MEPRRPGKLEAFLAVASTAVMVWYVIPSHEREQIRLRLLHRLHRECGKLARRIGYRGMGDELAGRDFQRYGLAFRLMTLRDQIGKALEDMQP